jgi:hypothetical protein
VTIIHHYTFTWSEQRPVGAHHGNAHFASCHGDLGSNVLSTSHPADLNVFRSRANLASILKGWRYLAAHQPTRFALTRGVSGYI